MVKKAGGKVRKIYLLIFGTWAGANCLFLILFGWVGSVSANVSDKDDGDKKGDWIVTSPPDDSASACYCAAGGLLAAFAASTLATMATPAGRSAACLVGLGSPKRQFAVVPRT